MAWSSLPPWIFSYYFVLAVLVVPIICQTPLAISASPTFYNPTIGTPVTLNCVVASGNATSITWLKYNSILNISGDSRFTNGDVSTPSLSISNVQQTDSGSYVCRAADATGTVVNSNTITVSPQGTPPVVTIAHPSYSQFTGQQITLVCTVSSTNSPLQSVQWTFTNQGGSVTDPIVISTSSPLKYSGSTTSIPSLTVSSLASTDQGTYRCRASNLIGTTTSDQTVLSVTGAPLAISASPTFYNPTIGTPVTLNCVVASGNATSITWLKDNSILNISGDSRFINGDVSTPSLSISNVQQTDSGSYVCRAADATGTVVNSSTITVSPQGTPPFVTIAQPSYSQFTGQQITLAPLAISASPTFYNPTIGTPVTLNCVVASGNATSITWLKDNSILNISGDSRFINGDMSTPSLSISNVQQTDSGSYVCRAADATGTVVNSSTITVSPQGTPPVVTIAHPSYSQFTGQQITLGCTVSSTNSPLQSVQWTFTNQGGSVTDPIVISTSSPLKYSGSTTSIPSLTVSSLASTDQGTYRCRASNLIGTTTSDQTVLSVTGSLLSVDVSPNSANVVQGTNQQITCTVAGTPEATGITWTRSSNNQLTTLDIVNSNGKYTGGTTSDPHLNIDNFQSSDAGTYVCRATNVVGSQNSDNSVLTYIQPLTLTISPPSGTATYGDASYTIQCQITGTTASLWSWTKTPINGGSTQQITQGSKYSIQNSPINPFLTINNIVEEDEADYACQATNLAGSASSSNSRFTVTGSTLTVGISPSSANVLQSTNQSVHCLISGQPSANNIQWLKTINSVQTSIDIVNSGGKYSGGTTGNPHITINNFQSSDTGIYVCRVTNAYGTETSPTSILTYIQSLSITISPLYGTAIVGDSSYQIQCQISGTTASSWSWTKTPVNGGSAQQITLGSNYSIQNSPTNPFLTINNIVEADEADYACQATNVAGSASSSNSRLIVNGGALSVSVTPATHSAVIGDNIVVIQCTVSGIPQATSWYWTCLPLASGSGSQTTIIQGTNNADYTVSNSNTNPHLTIKTITAADAGDYSCHATNVVGTSSSPQSRLAVTGDALSVSVTPATQGAVIGDNSVVIQCTVSGIPQALSWSWTSSPLGSGSGSQTTIAKGTNNGDYIVANSNTNPHLTIKTITTADAGDYICRATNAVGTSSSQKSRLTVTGEPDFYGGEIIALSWSIVIVIILLIALIVCSVLLGRRICRSAAECKDKDMGITSNRGKADVPRFDRVPTASTRPHNALHTPQHRVSRSDEYIDGRYETIPDRSYYVPHDAYYVPQDAYYVPHDAFYVPQADCI